MKLGSLVIVVGVLVIAVCAAADPIGLGKHPGIGPRQLAGIGAGVALVIAGLVVSRRSK